GGPADRVRRVCEAVVVVNQLRCTYVTPRSVEWSVGIAQDRTAGVDSTGQRVIEEGVAVRGRAAHGLERSNRHTGLEAIGSAPLPATEDMPHDALLVLHPGQLVDDVHAEYIRVGLRGKPLLPNIGIERVLRNRCGDATCAGEDFACVIKSLAPGVGKIRRNTMEAADLQFILPAVVFRPRTIVTDTQVVEVAVHATHTTIDPARS